MKCALRTLFFSMRDIYPFGLLLMGLVPLSAAGRSVPSIPADMTNAAPRFNRYRLHTSRIENLGSGDQCRTNARK